MNAKLPVFSINNFEDYNRCEHCGNNFYVRKFNNHLRDNDFLDKPHGHDFFILLFITQGTGTHNIDFKLWTNRAVAFKRRKLGRIKIYSSLQKTWSNGISNCFARFHRINSPSFLQEQE